MFGWIQKKLVERWIKELKQNVEGIRKMAEDYRRAGGFREIAETVAKFGEQATDLFPKVFLEAGRKVELEFADACERLANMYEQLLNRIEEKLKDAKKESSAD